MTSQAFCCVSVRGPCRWPFSRIPARVRRLGSSRCRRTLGSGLLQLRRSRDLGKCRLGCRRIRESRHPEGIAVGAAMQSRRVGIESTYAPGRIPTVGCQILEAPDLRRLYPCIGKHAAIFVFTGLSHSDASQAILARRCQDRQRKTRRKRVTVEQRRLRALPSRSRHDSVHQASAQQGVCGKFDSRR